MARLCGSKPPSEATEEEDAEPVRMVGKGILRPVSVGGCRGAPPGGTMHPGSSSSTRPPDQGSGQELQFIDWAGRPPKHDGQGPLSEPASGGDHSRDQASGKVPLKMNFPKFDGAFPRIWRDKCLDYFRVCNIHPTMWLTAATLHLEGNAAHWFQAYKLTHTVQGWPDFITAVEAQFGIDDYRQFMSSLLSLKQSGTVSEFCTQFQELVYKILSHNPHYDETFFVSQFLKGLKPEIRAPVASQILDTLDRAILLAHVQQDLQTKQKP
jgi:hypothetical protein